MKIEYPRTEVLMNAAVFMTELNKLPVHHVGYCGDNADELARDLAEFEMPFDKSFVLLRNNGEIQGVLGFDLDPDLERTWIWGPFVSCDWLQGAEALWAGMLPLLPATVNRLDFFYNVLNTNALNFARSLGAAEESREVVLTIDRLRAEKLIGYGSVSEMAPKLAKPFARLHDRLFPGTYYSGHEILERINPLRKIWVKCAGDQVLGYIYLEAEPEAGTGSIEFFGVDPSARGQGVGKELLVSGLKWLFSFPGINSMRLCVNEQNRSALGLYRQVGFVENQRLIAFGKHLNI